MNVRVRYAPSPTGLQHVGSVRTVLFDYFLAKANDGTFMLRIEDTDQARTTEDAMQDLYDTFAWLGIEWDEGPDKGGPNAPYIQSERAELYKEHVQKLIDSGHAYTCYCSAERLDGLRKEQGNKGGGYDRHCRDLPESDRKAREAEGIVPVVRFKVPTEGRTTLQDAVLDEVSWKHKDIPVDPIIMKSDGLPTYHLAAVVDDHVMGITHVLRGQEWLPSAPLHLLMYKAFGWDPPVFCHLPLVNGKDGQKLGKRHGSTSIRDFRKAGYLPETMINYLVQLGWSYDDQREFFTKEELSEVFSLEKINKAPAVFDYKKLEWFNGQYIRKKNDQELEELLVPYLVGDNVVADPPSEGEKAIIRGMLPLVRERLRLLPDVSKLVSFLFHDVEVGDAALLVPKRLDAAAALTALRKGKEIMEGFESRSDEENEDLFRQAAEDLEIKLGDMLMPVRVAVTGSTSSPPLFGSVRLLGAGTTLSRMDRAIRLLEGAPE